MFNPQAALTAMIAQEDAFTLSIHVAFPGAHIVIEVEYQCQLVVLSAEAPAEAVIPIKQKRTALMNNQRKHLVQVLLKEKTGSSEKLWLSCLQCI